MRLAKIALLFSRGVGHDGWPRSMWVNRRPEANLPFTMTTTSTFELPWRIAFLPDGRMLVTEKIGPVWLVSADRREDQPGRRHARRLLARSERHARRVHLAALRHRPEHLPDVRGAR